MTTTAVFWINFAIMWLVTLMAWTTMTHWRRRLNQATADMVRAAQQYDNLTVELMLRPSEIETWAKWTMLTVTDRQGNIFATTLLQLFQNKGLKEMVWADPIMTSLWQADKELHAKWQNEVEKLYNEQHTTEENDGA